MHYNIKLDTQSEDNKSDNLKSNDLTPTNDMVNIVFNSTKRYLDNLQDGERITFTDLIDKVVADTKLKQTFVNGLATTFAHTYSAVTVEHGRGGGIYKGGKKKHIDKRERCETCSQVLRKKD